MPDISRSQVDRLGERLKGTPTAEDLQLLADYRRSFQPALAEVVEIVRAAGAILPQSALSTRPAKSTVSIIRKLRRESIRLSQMQDIAGCRLVVSSVTDQDAVVAALLPDRPLWTVQDRRTSPSYGYRAVHVIAAVQRKPIEIQVRTALQHGWAEISEALDRVAGGDIKYGGGPAEARETLDRLSDIVATLEQGKPLDPEVSPRDLINALGMMLIGYMAQRRGGDP
jgi:ppGpp synthetase/RelA/SpoT-type nucleotidyltranferase